MLEHPCLQQPTSKPGNPFTIAELPACRRLVENHAGLKDFYKDLYTDLYWIFIKAFLKISLIYKHLPQTGKKQMRAFPLQGENSGVRRAVRILIPRAVAVVGRRHWRYTYMYIDVYVYICMHPPSNLRLDISAQSLHRHLVVQQHIHMTTPSDGHTISRLLITRYAGATLIFLP